MTRSFLLSSLSLIALSACAEMVTDVFEYGSIEVEAVRRNGEPVPGVELTLYSSFQVMAQAKTDENGYHLFEFVPPNQYGVHAEPPEGYTRPDNLLGGPSTAHVDGIVMKEGGEGNAQFTYLKIGPGRVEVSVREVDGAPVEDAVVHLTASDRELGQDTVDSTGTVGFEQVPFGVREVWVLPPPLFLDVGERPPARRGLLVEDGTDLDVAFILERCLGTIRGSIQDLKGEPVSGYPLRLYRPFEDVKIQDTGADGEGVFDGLRCQEFGLALVPHPDWTFEAGRGSSYYDGLQVNRGSDRTFSFTVKRCQAQVRVAVSDSSQVPVQGVLLELYTARESWASARTGEDGTLSFSGRDAPCNREIGVAVRPGVGYMAEEGRGSSFVDGLRLTDGAVESLAFTVARCTPRIQVHVEDEAGSTVPNATLELYSSGNTLDTGSTDGNGDFTFMDFACGLEYGVKVKPPAGYTVSEGRGSSYFDGLRPGGQEVLRIVFRLQSTGP